MAVGLTQHYLEGAWFPKGGGQVLSDRLAAAIEEHGGKILLCSPARRILVEAGRVTGVEIDSHHLGRRVVRAPIVISNADYKRTVNELVGAAHFSKKTVARVERAEMSPAFGVLYLGLSRDLKAEGHPRTNYWIFPNPDLEAEYAAAARGEVGHTPMAYISIASLKDPTNRRVAPPGITNLQVMSLAPSSPAAWGVTEAELLSGAYRKSAGYQAKKRAFAEAMLRSASRVFPGIDQQIVYQEVATPLTHRRYTGATGGTSYGLAHTPAHFLRGRPGSKTELPGLYLAGASCRTGHGIAGVMMSGVAVTAELLGGRVWGEVFGKENAGPRPTNLTALRPDPLSSSAPLASPGRAEAAQRR
ncbi:MAG: Phytoene dehydrogenase or related enzyme [Myxococcaceae bacterium]|nr:Phytoene dehydrogenase or related enzyme [Myxococcaceae bacterium]